MKNLALILIFFAVKSVMAQNDCVRDTLYHANGEIRLIYDYDNTHHEHCGIYMEFDSLGVKRSEGSYRSLDSVECMNCYAERYPTPNKKWEQYTVARHQSRIPVGEWKYYHENGVLKEKGSYCEAVHQYKGTSYPLEWEGKTWPEPVAGYLTTDFLKNGIWECYDENGNNIRTEEYVCGQLVFLIERY